MTKLTCFLLFVATFLFYKLSFANSCKVMVNNSQTQAYASEVTVVIGTDRAGSKSAIIAAELVSQLVKNPNVKVNLVDLAKLPKSIFKTDYFAKKSKLFQSDFVDPIARAGGVIFVVPEYDGAVPGILSYYMNHVRESFDKKQVALVGISAGKWGARSALDGFKATLTHRRARILGDQQVNIENIETKIEGNELNHADSKNRLAETAKQVALAIKMASWDNPESQRIHAAVLKSQAGGMLSMTMNNSSVVIGQFSKVILNENATPAYVQFSGPTKIMHNQKVIPGQDVDVHNLGYGMPVGAIKNFKKGWHLKANFAATKLEVGKKVKLEYESGVLVDGKVKNLTFDNDGNLLVITFSDVVVTNKAEVLFQKEWGDFDIAVGDCIEETSLVN